MKPASADDEQLLRETSYRLLLTTIPRWTIINMRKSQSVAEHSFNVLLLSLSLYDYMQTESHNRYDRESVILWAVDHDMDEIVTGDMPAPLKIELNRQCPGAMDQTIDGIMARRLPSFVGRKMGVKDSYPYHVVKIADKLEEVLFNQQHGYEARAQEALVDGLRLLRERLLKAEKANPRYDWDRARQWMGYFLQSILLAAPTIHVMPSMNDIIGPA